MAGKNKDKHNHKHVEGNGIEVANHVTGDVKTLHLGKDCQYEKELRRLQVELVKLQEWVKQKEWWFFLRGAMQPARAEQSSESPSRSIPACAGWLPSVRRLNARKRSGTFSAM